MCRCFRTRRENIKILYFILPNLTYFNSQTVDVFIAAYSGQQYFVFKYFFFFLVLQENLFKLSMQN